MNAGSPVALQHAIEAADIASVEVLLENGAYTQTPQPSAPDDNNSAQQSFDALTVARQVKERFHHGGEDSVYNQIVRRIRQQALEPSQLSKDEQRGIIKALQKVLLDDGCVLSFARPPCSSAIFYCSLLSAVVPVYIDQH